MGGGLGGKNAPARPTPPGGPGGNIAPARPTVMVFMTSTAKPKWSNTLVALMGKIFDRRTRQNRVYARPTLGPTHASWQLKNPTGKIFDRRVPGHVKVGTHIRSIRTLHTCLSFLCFIPSFPTLSHILFQAGAFMRRIIFPSDARRCCFAEQSVAVARTRQNRVYARPSLGPTHASWQLKNPTLPLQ